MKKKSYEESIITHFAKHNIHAIMSVLSTLSHDKSIRFGLMVGVVFSINELRRLRRRQSSNLAIARLVLLSLLKYPLFAYLQSAALKNAVQHDALPLMLTKTAASCFALHASLPLLNHDMALLLLVRALHSFCLTAIPRDLQPGALSVYLVVHALAYCSVTIWSAFSSNKMWDLFEKCISERRRTWEDWSAHHHRAMLPDCARQLHRESRYRQSCLMSALHDLSLSAKQTFPYFLQLHLYTKVIFKYNRFRLVWSSATSRLICVSCAELEKWKCFCGFGNGSGTCHRRWRCFATC